ncbi:MAG: CidA/LrgA family protein [Bacteroidota bacterium]
MKIIGQLAIILAVYMLGVALESFFSLTVPGSIIGMLIMLLLLYLRILKVEHIKEVSAFFLNNMMFFFIPATVSIMVSYHALDGMFGEITLLIILSTLLTIIPTALIVQFMAKRKDGRVDRK